MASKDNLSISFKVKYNFICIRLKLSHAYRYRLEQYCGKRERRKFARTRKICINYAPINVKLLGGEAGQRRGI